MEATNTRITDATQSLKVVSGHVRVPAFENQSGSKRNKRLTTTIRMKAPPTRKIDSRMIPQKPRSPAPIDFPKSRTFHANQTTMGAIRSAIALITRMPMPTRPRIRPPTKP